MRYIGSKRSLMPFIKETIHSVVGRDLSQSIFCDLFAGTGAVGCAFKKEVKQVISNDIEHYSYVLNKNYIENHLPLLHVSSLIDELNQALHVEGFIYQHYCTGSGSGRLYFSDENAKKIDAIRLKIEEWKRIGRIGASMYYFLLASLLESADRVANTASMYGSFLKTLKPTAKATLELKPAYFQINDNSHVVYQEDANALIQSISGDILYLDPPYNFRHYGAYYHLLNTIAAYDDFIPKGKTGLRTCKTSLYCLKKSVHVAFEELISNAQFKYIFVSYNNEGYMSQEEIKAIMSSYGRYSVVKSDYKRFNPNNVRTQDKVRQVTSECLHVVVKD